MEPKQKAEVLFKYRRIWKSKHTKSETLKNNGKNIRVFRNLIRYIILHVAGKKRKRRSSHSNKARCDKYKYTAFSLRYNKVHSPVLGWKPVPIKIKSR